MAKRIEEKYKTMTELEHALMRPGMHIGSTQTENKVMFIYDTDEQKMIQKELSYVPGVLKIFDEVLSNSCDEYRRKDNMGLNEVWVKCDLKNAVFEVTDNGGIPIVMHKDAGCYVPEFIFGRLRTSSNYDDTDDRNVLGTNGLGAKLSNIFSKSFSVWSCDGKKTYWRSWEDNMKKMNDDLEVVKLADDKKRKSGTVQKKLEHWTTIKFTLDMKRFDLKGGLDETGFGDIVRKRCIDAAAANSGLKVHLEMNYGDPETYCFKSFKNYVALYSDFIDPDECIEYDDTDKRVFIYPDNGINVGFINGGECSQGTHIKALRAQVNAAVCGHLEKKEKISVNAKGVDGKYSVFCELTVSNPAYSSQTKEELVTQVEKFAKDGKDIISLPETFIKKVLKSEIVEMVLDWYRQKTEAEDKAQLRKLNKAAGKKLFRGDKFINCNSRTSSEKQLWLFEGDSAKAGFRIARDPQTQAGYILRGKPKNSYGMSALQVMKHECFADIVNIMGLKWGEYNKKENLNFGSIVVSSDSDYDGQHICGLLLLFANHFPELFEQGVFKRAISPIIIATKGSEIKEFYKLEDFKKDERKLTSFTIKFLKGLGGLSASEYHKMMAQPIFYVFQKDSLADSSFKQWFAKDAALDRRTKLSKDVSGDE